MWESLLALAIVGTVISAIVNLVKTKNWSWWKIQLIVAVLSLIAAGIYIYGLSGGWDWQVIGELTVKYLTVANAVYAAILKPLAPNWSEGR